MRANASVHLALFLLAGSVLVLEVALTRVFSVMLWNHYTFLVISMALLGFGAAGSFLSASRPAEGDDAIRSFLARSCFGFALATLLSVMAVTRLDVEPTQLLRHASGTAKLGAMYVIAALPFFFAGLAICRLLTASAGQISTLYFADLVGAGVGALGVPFLLQGVGAPATLVGACALGALAGVLFAGPGRRAAGSALLAALLALALFVQLRDPWTVHPPLSKPLRKVEGQIELTRWSLHARIDVLASRPQPAKFGSGVSASLYRRPVEYRTVYMDGSNPSRLVRWDQDRWFLDRVLTAAPYGVIAPGPRVLIIGSGGGIDTMVALEHGAAHVTAVEINPTTVDLVSNAFADYLGRVFENGRVTLLAREGRHFLTLDEGRYDLVRLTGVDTSAAAASAANSLDHAYIYTVEALRDLYAHLADDGLLAISRACNWEAYRLVNVVRAALAGLGVDRIDDRVAMVSNGRWCDTLLRTRPFRRDEIGALTAWVEASRLRMIHDPFRDTGEHLSQLVRARGPALDAFLAGYAPHVDPVTDDDPFFFEFVSPGQVLEALRQGNLLSIAHSGYVILLVTFVQAVVLSALFILVPLLARSRTGTRIGRNAWSLPYFALLGLGFILVELVFIQKFMIVVGGPARAMSVTLFSILVFGGLGAYWSRRVDLAARHGLAWSVLGVAGLVLLSVGLLRVGLPWLLGLDAGWRIGLGVAALAPFSFALGCPFPLGIRAIERDAPELVPWAWAGNACATVIGSVLCQIVSIAAGFTVTLLLAAGCYLLAAACALRAPATVRQP